MLKTQQIRVRSEKQKVSTKESNKFILSSNDHSRIKSIDSVETYPCGTRRQEEIQYVRKNKLDATI